MFQIVNQDFVCGSRLSFCTFCAFLYTTMRIVVDVVLRYMTTKTAFELSVFSATIQTRHNTLECICFNVLP